MAGREGPKGGGLLGESQEAGERNHRTQTQQMGGALKFGGRPVAKSGCYCFKVWFQKPRGLILLPYCLGVPRHKMDEPACLHRGEHCPWLEGHTLVE